MYYLQCSKSTKPSYLGKCVFLFHNSHEEEDKWSYLSYNTTYTKKIQPGTKRINHYIKSHGSL